MRTDSLPVVTGFGDSSDLLVNGPNGTGRMSGEEAKRYFDTAFEYALYAYDGADLTVKFAMEIALHSDVWAWLKARLAAHNVAGIHIKDYIPVTCTNGYVLKMQVAGINQYLRFNGTELTAWHIDFISKDLWPDKHVWNKVNYNNGLSTNQLPYLCSDLKAWLNSESASVPNGTVADPATVAVDYSSTGVLDKLPAELRNAITPKQALLSKRYTAGSLLTDDNSWDWGTLGKLWVPAEMEVYGTCVWGTKGYSQGAFTQYPIFRDSKMRIKGLGNGGGRYYWWLLTPYSGSSATAADVTGDGLARYYDASYEWVGAPVCFRIQADAA